MIVLCKTMQYSEIASRLDPIIKIISPYPLWHVKRVEDETFVIFIDKWPMYWISYYRRRPVTDPSNGIVDSEESDFFSLSFVNLINFDKLKDKKMLHPQVAEFDIFSLFVNDVSVSSLHGGIIFSMFARDKYNIEARVTNYVEEFGPTGTLSRLIGLFATDRLKDEEEGGDLVGYQSVVVSGAPWGELIVKDVVMFWAQNPGDLKKTRPLMASIDQLSDIRTKPSVVSYATLGVFPLNLRPTNADDKNRQPTGVKCFVAPEDRSGLLVNYESTALLELNLRLSTQKELADLMVPVTYNLAWNVRKFNRDIKPKHRPDDLLQIALASRLNDLVVMPEHRRNYVSETATKYLARVLKIRSIPLSSKKNFSSEILKNAVVLCNEPMLPMDELQWDMTPPRVAIWNLDAVLLDKVMDAMEHVNHEKMLFVLKDNVFSFVTIPLFELVRETLDSEEVYDPETALVEIGKSYYSLQFARKINGVNPSQLAAFRGVLVINAMAVNKKAVADIFSLPPDFLKEIPRHTGLTIITQGTWNKMSFQEEQSLFDQLMKKEKEEKQEPILKREDVNTDDNIDTWGLVGPKTRIFYPSDQPASMESELTATCEILLRKDALIDTNFHIVWNSFEHDPPIRKDINVVSLNKEDSGKESEPDVWDEETEDEAEEEEEKAEEQKEKEKEEEEESSDDGVFYAEGQEESSGDADFYAEYV